MKRTPKTAMPTAILLSLVAALPAAAGVPASWEAAGNLHVAPSRYGHSPARGDVLVAGGYTEGDVTTAAAHG